MATRLKTVEYWFPWLQSIPDVSATAFSQITVYIPEATAGVTFRSVTADIVVADQQTAATNITQRQLSMTLQGASASTVNNTQTYTNSGENIVHQWSADFTSYFNSNFGTNASRTLDCSVTINTSTVGSANASLRMVITYSFDDTVTTHLKTVWIPLNADVNALATTKTACDTIPALDTYLPEASKSIRQVTFVTQGNQEQTATTDTVRRIDIDSISQVDATYEQGLATASWYRLSQVYSFDTSVTHTAYSWASTTDYDHPQNYLVVTYEFDASTTTSMMVSLLLPMEFAGPMGGPSATDAQRGERILMIQEANPVMQRLAAFVFYDQFAAISSTLARIGAASYSTYSSVGTAAGGGFGLMVRRDDQYTLVHGRNSFTLDIYNADNNDLGFNLSALWMVNYTADVPTEGYWAANHTVQRCLRVVGTSGASAQTIVSSVAPDIPETEFFLTSVGVHYVYVTNGTGNASGVHIGAENDAGNEWLNVYESMGGTDPETGIRQSYATARSVFNRFAGDAETGRTALQTARRWRLASAASSFDTFWLLFTYHSITYDVSGSISASNGGTVNMDLIRDLDHSILQESSRSGNGSFSFTWYDDTENVHVSAYEDGTHVGRSNSDLAV